MQALAIILTLHFISDYMLQSRQTPPLKHIFWNPYAICHSLTVAIFTAPVFGYVTGNTNIFLMCFVYIWITHHIIDYGKMNIGKYLRLTQHDKMYWNLIGIDQLLHTLIYIRLMYYITVME